MDALRSSVDRVQGEAFSLTGAPERFRHEALFYAGEQESLTRCGAFVRDGLESDEPMLVVLSEPKAEALRSELGVGSERVQLRRRPSSAAIRPASSPSCGRSSRDTARLAAACARSANPSWPSEAPRRWSSARATS